MTDAKTQIDETVKANDVVLYMKGTKEMPQCGFSSRVAGVLNFMGVDYQDVNVLAPPISGAPQSTALSMPSSNPLPVLPTPIPVPASMPSPQPAINDGISNLSAAGSSHQTFILVKVPPNTKPGTTIHVQVPGESTIIAAQVPPGVDEFHVAYNHPDTGASNVNPDGSQDRIRTGQISSSNGVGNEDRGEMEYLIPIVAGTALMGAAGLSILNHTRR